MRTRDVDCIAMAIEEQKLTINFHSRGNKIKSVIQSPPNYVQNFEILIRSCVVVVFLELRMERVKLVDICSPDICSPETKGLTFAHSTFDHP